MSTRFDTGSHVSLQGKLLVAAPDWNHEFFRRSIVMVVHHDHQAAIGIILNRPAPKWPLELLGVFGPAFSQIPAVHFGGNQSGPIVALHNNPTASEYSPAEGIYFAASVDSLRKLSKHSTTNIKLVIGQSHWAAGELDVEFQNGNWLPLPISKELVLGPSDTIWQRAMRQIGNHFVASITGISSLPPSCLAN